MLSEKKAKEILADAAAKGGFKTRVRQLKDMTAAHEWLMARAEATDDDDLDDHDDEADPDGRFRLSSLSEEQRRRVFAAVFPKMTQLVEAAWEGTGHQAENEYLGWSHVDRPTTPKEAADARDGWWEGLVAAFAHYNPDVTWIAEWIGHMESYRAHHGNMLLASAIERGGPEGERVLRILMESAAGTHEIARMGDHVVPILIASGNDEAFALVEKLLLAAKRDEGLRSSILSLATIAGPDVFRRVLEIVERENLTRFTSTVYAINDWFGFEWDSAASKHTRSIVERVLRQLRDDKALEADIAAEDAESAYLGLFVLSMRDAAAAQEKAIAMLADRRPAKRWVGVRVLGQLRLDDAIGRIAPLIGDKEFPVAAEAFNQLQQYVNHVSDARQRLKAVHNEAFDRLKDLLKRLNGKKVGYKPLAFPWDGGTLEVDQVGGLLVDLCPDERAEEAVAYLDRLGPYPRAQVLTLLTGHEPAYLHWKREKKEVRPLTPLAKATVLKLLGDPATHVRERAAEIVALYGPPTADEVTRQEELLEKAAGDIRSTAISRLLMLDDAAALASAERLLGAGKMRARGGLEVLLKMIAAERGAESARALASAFKQSSKKLGAEETKLLGQILTKGAGARYTLNDALGLAKGFRERPTPTLREIPLDEPTKAAVAVIWSLEDLVAANKSLPVVRKGDLGYREEGEDNADAADEVIDPDDESLEEYRRLGGMQHGYGTKPEKTKPREADLKRCPVRDLVVGWLEKRPSALRDRDGRELVRAWQMCRTWYKVETAKGWPEAVQQLAPAGKKGTPKFGGAFLFLLEWAMRFEGANHESWMLDQFEASLVKAVRDASPSKKIHENQETLPELWQTTLGLCPSAWTDTPDLAKIERLDGVLRASRELVRPFKPAKDIDEDDYKGREPETLRLWKEFHDAGSSTTNLVHMWAAGIVPDAELYLRLAGPETYRESAGRYDYYGSNSDLGWVMRRVFTKCKYHRELPVPERLPALLGALRARILEIECVRGDADTPASHLVKDLNPSGGIDAVVPAAAGLGKLKLCRQEYRTGKAANLSTIIRNSRPGAEDTAAAFAKAAKAAKLTDQRLVEVALFQPNWAAHIEHALGWKGFEDGVLWLRAHTKEAESWSLEDDKEPWEGKVEERTRIPEVSRNAGAVDRAWFERCYKALGKSRWEMLYDAAKYATSGTGHVRARLWADAMLGNVTEKELTERITKKRHQDAARALGLLEIKAGAAGKAQVLARYQVLQEMRRTSRKHGGSMLQASEKRAVEIGMENLAWTAGYPDPLRLQWAMEIEEFGDLAKGPVSVTVGDTTVTLAVDDEGVPSLSAFKTIAARGVKKLAGKAAKGAAAKAGKGAAKPAKKGAAKGAAAKGAAKDEAEPAAATVKPLKSVPPTLKKDKKVAPLVERLPLLRRQNSRIRLGLEQAMCRGDSFSGGELSTLWGHPILRTAIRNLVMIGATKSGGTLIGYPDKEGKVLRGVDGSFEPLKATDTLRIAHPLDLLATKKWHAWQKECFTAERMQPFKQVFREVYTPTATELKPTAKEKASRTSRYAGQQLQPRQALALFGSRGWVAKPEEGVQRIFHAESVTAHVEFEEGFYTPAEIDGLTLAALAFVHTTKHEPIAIKDIPPRLFSEIMRDLDLVVSVAHRGQVDPEASHSTVEMRAALLRETAQLLGLTNITIDQSRAIIKGQRAEYALHLGSGTIHMLPGGALWIVPVHSQHRGRVFLPFADNDPKTAEVITKAIVLARDSEIKDPAILSQLRAAVG